MEESNIKSDNSEIIKEKKTPIGFIIFSGFSFIPAIGIIFGIISIMISLFNFKRFKLLFILGLSGIMVTVILYSSLYYFGTIKRGGVYDDLRINMNIYLLQEIQKEANNYKCKHGYFPKNLIDLEAEYSNITSKDPILLNVENYKGDSLFCFKSTTDSIIVFSVGMDGKPNTNDDIHPYDDDKLSKSH